MTATYQPPVATYHPPSVPVYHAPSSLPDTSYHTQSRPAYRPFDPPTTISFNPTVVQSDLFFQPVKKRPPRRHHKKFSSHHGNSVAPGTKFHFVEDFSSPVPGPQKVKRFPAETASSLDVGPRPGRGGVVALLKAEDLTVMAALLEETHLDRSIDKQGQFTLFVPTDLAFNQFLQKLGGIKEGVNKLKQNPTELERIVKNHLVRGLVKADDLADDLVGPSVAGTKLRSNVYHSEDRDWRDVKVITINGANVLRTDVATAEGRGLVHVVDRVLFPPTVGDVVQTLQADPEQRFTTFVKALQATRLDREITDYNTGPWTVFAPTNAAFMNLPMKELEELITDPKKLSRLVLNHLINRTIFSAGMKAHQRLTMANGNRVNLFARDDRLKIEGSNVINKDIPASNGVVQVVENIIELGKSPI